MKTNQNGEAGAGTLVIWRDTEKIKADIEFISEILPAVQKLCKEILDYPLPINLEGSFDDVYSHIKKQIPFDSRPGGKFRTEPYDRSNPDGSPIFPSGHWLMIDFEKQQKELLFEKTGGKISNTITLARDAFLQFVAVKDGRPVVAAKHDVGAIIYENQESFQRCRKLLAFKDGSLIVDPDAARKIEGSHSILASPGQCEIYVAVRDHIEALKALGAPDAFCIALKNDDPEDLRWLNLAGGITIHRD
jgi:hypothetical protein